MPYSVKGITVLSEDGFCNVYINARLSDYEQRKAVKHELTHIFRDDLYADEKSIHEVENIKIVD